jgi:hypothetical protein
MSEHVEVNFVMQETPSGLIIDARMESGQKRASTSLAVSDPSVFGKSADSADALYALSSNMHTITAFLKEKLK